MARQHWRNGLDELHRSLSKPAFVRALQRLLPEVTENDLVPGGSGVRAQALKPDGALVDDFQFVPSGKVLHVLNVPSPAATASLAIGKAIVDMATEASAFPSRFVEPRTPRPGWPQAVRSCLHQSDYGDGRGVRPSTSPAS